MVGPRSADGWAFRYALLAEPKVHPDHHPLYSVPSQHDGAPTKGKQVTVRGDSRPGAHLPAGRAAQGATANVTSLTTNTFSPIGVDSVTVLADISELNADSIRYERVAIITLKGSGGGFTDQQDLLDRAREEAGKLGANAVILQGFTRGNYNALWGTTSPNESSAVAIRYWFVDPEAQRDTLLMR